jgi:NAD(P)-dependent dehydrogenase (short-subunit alcohol dehydrogenase family)
LIGESIAMPDASAHGKVLLVTGGSRGIGAATARLAGARGYRVAVNFRQDAAAAEAVVRDIEAGGGEAAAFQADTAVEAEIVGLFDAVDRRFGRLTHFVNNAGIVGRGGKLADADAESIRAVLDTNLFGAILAAREAVRRMSTARGGQGGAIVNLSSRASEIGAPGEFVWYAASKGGVDSFTIGLAREVAAEGIRVNAVAPGLIDTEMQAQGGDPKRLERLMPTIPMGRAGTPDETAEAILWLLSDAASYVTGSILKVGGGR